MLYSKDTINELAKIICQKVIVNNYKVTDINNKLIEKLVSNALLECIKLEMSGENRMIGVEKQRVVKLFDDLLNALLVIQNNPTQTDKIYVGSIYRKFCGFINRFKGMK